MQVHESLIELVGNTPLVRLQAVTKDVGGGQAPAVLAKVEYFNPGGSVKDRIALRMVEAAEKSGALQPGGTIVEPTSGNTGVGLALVAQQRSYRTLERLCGAIADRLLADFEADRVMVRCAKPEPPIPLPVEEVSVELWRDVDAD